MSVEEVLKAINRKYITLDDPEVKENRKNLKSTINDMIDIMKSLDPTFKSIFQELYGEGHYDSLKVGKSDEFERDLLFYNLGTKFTCETHMRKNCGCVRLEQSKKPGYFWLKVDPNFYTPLNKFLEDGYLQTNKVLNWFKSLISRALSEMRNKDYSLNYKFEESEPDITLLRHGSFGRFKVKLVPAFQFGPENWPSKPYKANPSTSKQNFSIVPEQNMNRRHGERYWRASFQAQEGELIFDKQRLKPALRLLKKMRNNLEHPSVSSYALKTIVLWELNNKYINWNSSLTDIFLKLLKKYQKSLDRGEILCYWNKRYNLLEDVNPDMLYKHSNEIWTKLNTFKEKKDTDPLYIAKIILKEDSDEYRRFMEEYEDDTALEIVGATVGIAAVVGLGAALFGAWRQEQQKSDEKEKKRNK